MISLKDEISRFEKLVYNKELGEFIPVDQMFVGGGITIESIIHENSFIVEELKKMNAVFKNYCKLNEKVYNKIMEHELGVHSQQARLNGLTGTIERRLEETLKTIKLLQEEMLRENQKSTTFVGQALTPIKEELDGKVDHQTFAQKMKQVLEEYDDGGLKRENIDNQQHLEGETARRKKGKVGYDEFYSLKQDIDRRLLQTQAKLKATQHQQYEDRSRLDRLQPSIIRIQNDVESLRIDMYTNRNESAEQFNLLKTFVQRLEGTVEQRLSDQAWRSRLSAYHQAAIRPALNQCQSKIVQQKSELNNLGDQLRGRLKVVDNEATKSRSLAQALSRQGDMRQQEIRRLNLELQGLQKKSSIQFKRISTALQTLTSDCTAQISHLQKMLKQQSKLLRKQIDELSSVIEQSVSKFLGRKFGGQLQNIQADIKEGRLKQNTLKENISVLTTDIAHIKQLLSHKANFCDFLQHVDKKADREEIKDLEQKLQETSLLTKTFQQTTNHSYMDRREKLERRNSRQNSINRLSKTLAVPTSKGKHEMDSGTKIFMCGLEGALSDNRKMLSANSRRRSLKLTTVVNDFGF